MFHLRSEAAQNDLCHFAHMKGRTHSARIQHFSRFDNHPFYVCFDAGCVSEQVRHILLRMELQRTAGDTSDDRNWPPTGVVRTDAEVAPCEVVKNFLLEPFAVDLRSFVRFGRIVRQ